MSMIMEVDKKKIEVRFIIYTYGNKHENDLTQNELYKILLKISILIGFSFQIHCLSHFIFRRETLQITAMSGDELDFRVTTLIRNSQRH